MIFMTICWGTIKSKAIRVKAPRSATEAVFPKILIIAMPIWAWKTELNVEGITLRFNFVSFRVISRSGALCGAIILLCAFSD